ncbi:carboxypeptidase regulatory-like domain-containing protein, partial [Halorubrum sp. SD626R]|uniref:carboxypeptidase regulatory-like domain-containing protein n=1 Tax=Halorubrum sp. SD626R TaxID=1419722 RepID=UPI001F541AD8
MTNVSAPAIVERNATLEATANATNWGVVAGDNRNVSLRLTDPENASDTRTLDDANVSLDSGDAASVTLNGTVPDAFGAGVTTLSVASPDDEAAAEVRVAAAVGTVNGTVTDEATGATLADVDVVVRNGTEVVGETATDARGAYAVDVPAADLNVTASNATYAP